MPRLTSSRLSAAGWRYVTLRSIFSSVHMNNFNFGLILVSANDNFYLSLISVYNILATVILM